MRVCTLLYCLYTARGCGFEGPDLCGWTVDNHTQAQWHKHIGADQDIVDRAKGPRFDHTYGSSRQEGNTLTYVYNSIYNANPEGETTSNQVVYYILRTILIFVFPHILHACIISCTIYIWWPESNEPLCVRQIRQK